MNEEKLMAEFLHEAFLQVEYDVTPNENGHVIARKNNNNNKFTKNSSSPMSFDDNETN